MSPLLLLALGIAQATTYAVTEQEARIISTPLGEAPWFQARNVCMSEFVFVGDVVASNSYTRSDLEGGTEIVTDLTFQVGRTLYGAPGSSYQLTIPGGTVAPYRSPPPADFPRATIGLRYAIASSSFKQDMGGYATTGTKFLVKMLRVPTSMSLPNSALMARQLDTFCSSHSLDRHHDVVGG